MLHCVFVQHLLYPFLCQQTFRLLPCPSYGEYCCSELRTACIFLNYSFQMAFGTTPHFQCSLGLWSACLPWRFSTCPSQNVREMVEGDVFGVIDIDADTDTLLLVFIRGTLTDTDPTATSWSPRTSPQTAFAPILVKFALAAEYLCVLNRSLATAGGSEGGTAPRPQNTICWFWNHPKTQFYHVSPSTAQRSKDVCNQREDL